MIAIPPVAPTIRVATANILNDLSRWDGRQALLAEELGALVPDLIALQEVADPLGNSTAHRLAADLGGYSVWTCPKAGRGSKREGIAVLSRLPVEDHEILDLGGQRRVAQLVRARVGDRAVVLVNGHYYWPPGAHAAQVRQVERVLDRLGTLAPGTPVVACGDFNGTPESPPIVAMRRALASAHEMRHGREPEATFPTPLRSGNRLREALTRGALRLFTNHAGGSWRGTLDYIFVGPGVRVVECDVFLDRPAPGDPTLYASDHLGLVATLEIPPPERP